MTYGFTVYDRDGEIIAYNEDEAYDTPEEAEQAAQFYVDFPAYGSHEVIEDD
jgi:hypothetical protein